MEPSAVSDEKRLTVDLVRDKNGTDQVLLKNPKGASVKVMELFCFSNVYSSKILYLILFSNPKVWFY